MARYTRKIERMKPEQRDSPRIPKPEANGRCGIRGAKDGVSQHAVPPGGCTRQRCTANASHAWSELCTRGQSSARDARHPVTSRCHLPRSGAPPAPILKLGAPTLLLETEGLGQAGNQGGCLGHPPKPSSASCALPAPRMRGPWVPTWDTHPPTAQGSPGAAVASEGSEPPAQCRS